MDSRLPEDRMETNGWPDGADCNCIAPKTKAVHKKVLSSNTFVNTQYSPFSVQSVVTDAYFIHTARFRDQNTSHVESERLSGNLVF